MKSLNKLRQRRNNISKSMRYMALLLSFSALMISMSSMNSVRAQDQGNGREIKSGKSQGQNATKDEQSGKTPSFPDVQGDQDIDSQKGGDGDVKPNAPWPIGGGDASYSNGVYNCAGTSYTYSVVNGPPSVCGELHITRNGNVEITPNWICTDASGSATKGPWTVSQNQTCTNIFIRWPDGTRTSGGDIKIDDLSPPTVSIYGGYPGSFSGSASDAAWGSGFGAWTTVRVRFLNKTTGLYWNGSGYGSFSPVYFVASMSGGGTFITWSKTPPPPAHHVAGQQYEWYAEANDRCTYSNNKVTFTY